VRRGLRYTVRLLIVAGVLLVGMIVLAGRAHAADAPTDTAPSQEATSPPAGAEPAPDPGATPPAAGPAPDATAVPETTAVVGEAASDPTPADSPAAAAPPPDGATGSGSEASPDTTTGTDALEPTRTTDQSAEVTTSGTAGATTGSNLAVGNATGEAGGDTTGGTGSSGSGVGTAPAEATGDQSTSSIDQQVLVDATTDGRIDVLQVALIINIGLAGANSGVNTASALPGVTGTGGVAGVVSGDADVTGNQSGTQVIQAAQIGSGDSTGQVVTVLNIGIGFGDSGTNLAVGTLYTDGSTAPQATAVFGSPTGGGQATVGTGGAGAVGNRSSSGIVQITMAVAGDGGLLSVAQRAVIVNVGIAFANSGLNAAWAAGLTPEQAQLVEWVINALLDEFGITGSGSGGAVLGDGSAGTAMLQAGTAMAVGNDSSTGILQQVQGSVSGGAASADQRAMVGNFGFGVANTGLNAAGASLAVPAGIDAGVVAQVAAAEAALQRLITMFTDPSFTGQDLPAVQQAIDLGAALLQVNGDISAAETLAGMTEGEAGGAAVTVRQVSAVLDIGISFANSGDNLSVSVVSAEPGSTARAGATGDIVDISHVLGEAIIRTGDAVAVGNRALVSVCQADHDPACDPPPVVPPVTPPVAPPTAPPSAAPIEVAGAVLGRPGTSAPTVAGRVELAFTGSPLLDQASAGLGLAAAGLGLGLASSRRRRSHRRGRRRGSRIG